MSGSTFRNDVVDARQRVRRARVFSLACIVEIDLPCCWIEDDVFEDRAKHLGRAINVGLGLRRQLDYLRIATTFEVEHAIVGPAVFVVADQATLRIRGESRLAGS